MAPVLDSDGRLRWDDPNTANTGGGRYAYFDIGAYEYVIDSDGDGISDGWEVETGLDPEDFSDAAADLDADGKSNLEEYLAGTSPRDSLSCLRVTRVLPTEEEEGAVEVEWLTVRGRNYRVLWTEAISPPRGRRSTTGQQGNGELEDLTVWRSCSEPIEGTGSPVSFVDDGSTTGKAPLYNFYGRRFYRVEVW
jgi:hypothetical protein